MLPASHPRDVLDALHGRGRELQAAAAAERQAAPSFPRRALAASLRWIADRLDPAPLKAPRAVAGDRP